MAGSVSGGCVEGAVLAEATERIAKGGSCVLEFGVADDNAFAVGLACGGRIRVLVEPIGSEIPAPLLTDLTDRRAARQPVAYVVDTLSWTRHLAEPDTADPVSAFRENRSGLAGDIAIVLHTPPLRLAVVGAVHIAQPLLHMARMAGYDCTLIDPREAFASPDRFAGQNIVHDWPDEALAAYGLDPRTAVVTLTHDPKIDDPALIAALNAQPFYIGALGSTRTHAKRLTRLQAAGITEDQRARLHAPVGLHIGAQTPAEIAIAILAEMTLRLHRPADALPIRQAQAPTAP